jgi:hypothetical protein
MTRTDHIHVLDTRAWILACGLALSVSACGGGSSTPDASSPPDAAAGLEAASAPDGAAATPFCTSKEAITSLTDLSGTWVARVVGAQIVNALGADMPSQTILHLLVTITQQGANLVANGRYCNREQVSQGGLIKVVIPDLWAHTETPVHRTGTFAVGAEGFPVLTWDELSEAFGAVLVPPTDITLPTLPTDTRVIDQDGDGNPGITIAVMGTGIAGNLYVDQLQTTSVRAIAVGPNRFEGTLTFLSQQNVLDTSSASLTILYQSSGGTSRTDPVVCNSSFTMVKVADAQAADGGASIDGGTAVSCEWVRDKEATLFAQ